MFRAQAVSHSIKPVNAEQSRNAKIAVNAKLQAAINYHTETFRTLVNGKGDPEQLQVIAKWLGDCYMNHDRHQDAELFYRRSLGAAQERGDVVGELEAMYRLIDCFEDQARFDQALLLQTLAIELECEVILQNCTPREVCSYYPRTA